jgi:hypothetical protein
MIREKENNDNEGRCYGLKKFEEESYREAVSYINDKNQVSCALKFCWYCKQSCIYQF